MFFVKINGSKISAGLMPHPTCSIKGFSPPGRQLYIKVEGGGQKNFRLGRVLLGVMISMNGEDLVPRSLLVFLAQIWKNIGP
jgi:hypothetical protein